MDEKLPLLFTIGKLPRNYLGPANYKYTRRYSFDEDSLRSENYEPTRSNSFDDYSKNNEDCKDDENNEGFLDYIRMAFSEFGCVFVIVFLSCMGCTAGLTAEPASALQKGLTGGLSVMTAIQIFGHISGAHANPSVTLSALLMNVIGAKKAILYWISQVLGGLTGYAVHLYVTPQSFIESSTHCVTLPSPKITLEQAFIVEVVITFILCIAINTCWDQRCMKQLDSFSLRIGLIATACALAAGPYTGASMNPARSLGPAIWQRNTDSLHIYIFGPLLGGALSGLFYKHILLSFQRV